MVIHLVMRAASVHLNLHFGAAAHVSSWQILLQK
jgi:hypothetical protein